MNYKTVINEILHFSSFVDKSTRACDNNNGDLFMIERFETFTVLIAKISRNIRKIKTKAMKDYGLKSPQVSCLYFLYSNPLTAKELCERCEEDKATISRSLEFLETNDYLICESNHAKRYKNPFTLTEKGLIVGKEIFDKVNNVLAEVNKELPEKEREQFYRSLTIISDNLEKICNNTK